MNAFWEYVVYSLNLIVSISALILYFSTRKFRNKKVQTIRPKNLRLYIYSCFFPSMLILAIVTLFISIYYLSFKIALDYKYVPVQLLLAFCFQLIRVSLIVIISERIIATIFLEKYAKYSSSFFVFILEIIISIILTLAFAVPTVFLEVAHKIERFFIICLVLGIHSITLFTCKMLYCTNKKLYKNLAYRTTLKQRYQMVENVKVLSFIFPTIIIFAFIAPLGPLFNFFHRLCFGGKVTAAVTQLSYNCAFISMMFYRIFSGLRRRRRKIFTEKQPMSILSPLGKKLPINQQTDIYFAALDKQWN